MAIMQLNSNMVQWKILLSTVDNPKPIDVTGVIGGFVNSIRIRHGISEGNLTKRNIHSSPYEISTHSRTKKETSPSELDIQFAENSYLEDLFGPGTCIEIKMYNKFGRWKSVFHGEVRNYPYGGAKDMVNFNVRAFSKEIFFSNQERNRTFITRPLTRRAVVMEIASLNGFALDWNVEKNSKIVPNNKMLIQKGTTDMQLLDKLAKEWGCHWYFDTPGGVDTIVFKDGKVIFDEGDKRDIESYGPYSLGYRTDRLGIKNNVESVDWVQTTSQGGSEISPSVISYNEKGEKSVKHKINALGKTWWMKPEYEELAIRNPLAFGELSAYATSLTLTGQGYVALKKFYEPGPSGDPTAAENMTFRDGDSSGVELTIILNEGDIDLRAPRTGILYAGGDISNRVSSNLPAWLFQYSTPGLGKNATYLNIKETVLTYEQGSLKSELKATLRTSL